MKSNFFKSAALAAAIVMSLAASAAAQAADQAFKTTDGQAFGVHNVYRYDPAVNGQFLRVVFVNGGDSLYADNGSVFNKIVAGNPNLVQISGTQSVVDITYAARIVCQAGVSKIAIQGSSVIVEANDSCTMANQAIAKAK